MGSRVQCHFSQEVHPIVDRMRSHTLLVAKICLLVHCVELVYGAVEGGRRRMFAKSVTNEHVPWPSSQISDRRFSDGPFLGALQSTKLVVVDDIRDALRDLS